MPEPKSLPAQFKCMLCRENVFKLVHTKGRWHYLLCKNCGLVHLYPLPGREQAIVAYDDYLDGGFEEIANWRRMMQPVVSRSADLIDSRRRGPKGRLLDIGCGYGFFLNEMKQRGWQSVGIEISPAGRSFARKHYHLDVTGVPVEEIHWPEADFDIVTLFYVIEHLLDPPAMLARVHRWLKPGGLLLLRWPHSTPIVRLLGPLASKLDIYHTPYHFYDFSPRTLTRLLHQCGFSATETVIGGYTLPTNVAARCCSVFTGILGEWLERRSRGRLLLPGLSKTTLAVKPG